jgi:hypothetical protein
MDDDQSTDEVRSAEDVARRALALFSVVGLALGAERTLVLAWLSDNDLWGELSPSEAGFIDTPVLSKQQIIDGGWLSERLIMLLWALGAVDQLPAANEQCDTAVFQNLLPPFAPISVGHFVSKAELRSEAELIAMADDTLQIHWEARDARSRERTPRTPVDMEVIQERHHAINWVIGYDGLPWDEVTADT